MPYLHRGRRGRLTRVAAALGVAGALTILPTRSAVSAPATVEAGSGLGSATVATVAIVYGGYHLTLSLGDSDASYQSSGAEATSQGISLPAITAGATGGGDSSCGPSTGGSVPSPTDSPPFAPLTLDSSGGAQHKTSGVLPIGTEEASIGVDPVSASATTSAISLRLPGLVEISGQSTSDVSYAAGTQRTANGRSAADVKFLGGFVTLSGLTWTATNQSGQRAASAASFDIASAKLGLANLPLTSPADVAASLGSVNKVLAATGLEVVWPKTSESTETASVDGLTLRIKGSQLGNTILQPIIKLVTALGQLLAPIFKSGSGCGFDQLAAGVGTTQLVADVLLGVLAGGGEIDLTIGGASAGTAPPPAYDNPFGNGQTPTQPTAQTQPPAAGVPAGPASRVGGASTGDVLPAQPALPALPKSAAPVALNPIQSIANAAYRLACTSTSPAGPNHCSSGARAAVLGSLAVLALAVFAADLYEGRRRRPLPRRRIS